MESLVPESVIAGLEHRDPDAVAECYEAFANPLFRYLVGLCGDVTLAEDLVEATFVELIEYAPRLNGGGGAVRAWLFRAAKNNLLDARRKELRRGDLALDLESMDRPGSEPGPDEMVVSRDRDRVVRAALQHLSEDQREVLLLRFAGDLSGPEVAALTGRTVGAVKALQHRGIAALRRVLEKDP